MEKTNIDTTLIVLALVATVIGAYVLLTGNWATPITEWLLMAQDGILKNGKILLSSTIDKGTTSDKGSPYMRL